MPSPTFVLVLDDVLRKPGTEAVIKQGSVLYEALSNTGRLAILCGEDEARADWFLRTNGFVKHAYLIPEDPTSSPTPEGRRMAQIGDLRSRSAHVEFVVEPDPRIAAEIFQNGIPVMAYLHPKYTQPAFRPDYKSAAVPWDDLVSQVDYQIEMKAKNAYDFQDVD